jgi:hypothetical protein
MLLVFIYGTVGVLGAGPHDAAPGARCWGPGARTRDHRGETANSFDIALALMEQQHFQSRKSSLCDVVSSL